MAIEKCPYCYRPIGTHIHDPILFPTGSPYKWSNDTTLIYESDINQRFYKGFNQVSVDILQELQSELQTLELNNGIIPLTVFSSVNTLGKFQITGYHIKEMRDSVEKLLTELGLFKSDYFNYDENFHHIIHPNGDKLEWTDPITSATDLQNFQVKAIHIEDLRHYIQELWNEDWEKSTVGIYPYGSNITGIFQDWFVNTTPGYYRAEIYQATALDKKLKFYSLSYGFEENIYATITQKNKLQTLTDLYFDIASTFTGTGYYYVSLIVNIKLKITIPGYGDSLNIGYVMGNNVGAYHPFIFPYGQIGLSLGLSPYVRNIYNDLKTLYPLSWANEIDELSKVTIQLGQTGGISTLSSFIGTIRLQ